MSEKFKENPKIETDLISLRKATKYCDYSGDYLKLRARQGKLKAVKIGRMWATKKEWVQDYIRKMEGYKESAKIGTDLISLTKATKYCGYSGDYLKLRARQGKLKAVKIGRVWATKREWVENYVREMEEFKENRRRQGEVKLDVKEREVKEVRPIRRISLFPEFELRPALALALILLLLFSSIALSKETFKNILQDTIFYVQQTPKTITHVLKESKKSLASSLDSLNQSFINVAEVVKTTDYEDFKEPIPLFKEYFKWLTTNLKHQVLTFREGGKRFIKQIKEGTLAFGQATKDLTLYIYNLALRTSDLLVRGVTEGIPTLAKKIKKGWQLLVLEFQTKTKELKELVTKPWKIIPEKPPEKPILVEVTKEEFEKLKQEIERIKEEGLPVREITKEIEVSRITKIEPIKEITKEIKILDDESLIKIRTALFKQETDVEKLKLAARFGYVNVIFPDILPLTGDTTIITLGTISTGTWQAIPIADEYITNDLTLSSLGVSGSTTLGGSSSDTLTVNATSTFNAPVTMLSTTSLEAPLTLTSIIQPQVSIRYDATNKFDTSVSLTGNTELSSTGDLILTSGTGTLTLGSGTNEIVNTDADTAILINPNGTGAIQFHSSAYKISSTGDLTLGGRITFKNAEYIVNETDDIIAFVGASGVDNTDLYLDLDGTYPVFYSNTDTKVGIDDDLEFVGAQTISTSTGNLTIDTAGNLVISDATDLNNTLAVGGDITFDAATPNIAINDTETLTITDGTNTLMSIADGGDDGNVSITGDLDIGNTASDTVTFTAVVDGNIVSSDGTQDLGSSTTRWSIGYLTTVDATNISGTVTGGLTTSSSWTINSDNLTANAEIASLAFETGTNIFNAVEQWNASGDAGRVVGYDDNFLFNYPISIFSRVSGAEQTFTSGSLFNYGQNSTHAITQSGDLVGVDIDFSSNITGAADADITIVSGQTTALTSSGATTTNYTGFTVSGGALDTIAAEASATNINWYGLDIQMPNIDTGESGDTVTSYGLYIRGGTVTDGGGIENQYGLIVDSNAGNVGIGTTTPDYKLDVSGDINFTGKLLEDGNEILANVIAVFNGSCPTSWTEVTEARGRAIVGTPLGGTNAGTVGTALSNIEDRTHSHGFTPSGTVSSSFTGTAGTTVSDGVDHTHSAPAHYHGFGAGSGLSGGSGTSGTQSANHTHTMAHTHSINPPATASGNPSANHSHSVNPPSTGTNTTGSHSHSQTVDDYSNTTSFSYFVTGPDARGTKVTGTAGAHSHTVDIAAFNSGTVSAWHTHTTNIPAFTSGGSSAASTGGISASHTHSTPTHGHTGTIGLVTGGVNGNVAMTSGNASTYSHSHGFTPAGSVSSSFTGSAGTTGTASTSDTMPYIQLTVCQKDPGTDYAEWIESNEKIEEGMIVNVDPENDNKVVKSKTAYDKTVLGIVSTKPGWLIGRESATAVKLTLSGQVPVKVTLAKGEIKRGDPITSSNIEGFGMKATKKGRVVGIALTELNHSSLGLYECGENMCGEVTVLLDLSWYDPNSLISKIITVIGLFIVYSLILLGGYQLWKKRKGKNITKIRR